MKIRAVTLVFILFNINVVGQKQSSDLTCIVDNEEVALLKNNLTLSSGYHDVVVKISDKNCTAFTYQLPLLEASKRTTTFPEIRYTNLPGGSYTLLLECTKNSTTRWRQSIGITVKQNIWEKWWFWLFTFIVGSLVLFFIVYFWYLYDNRQRAKVEFIRQKIAADLHDEVGANLSSISFFIATLQKLIPDKTEQIDNVLNKISASSTESASLLNDTIWALHPADNDFQEVINRIRSFGNSLLLPNDIQFEMKNNLSEIDIGLNIEQKRNLYLIMKEAINNVAKHAQSQRAIIEINEMNDLLSVKIIDDGIGFEANADRNGNGLKNMVSRAIENKLSVEIKSSVGFGTIIEIKINKLD